VKSLNNMSIQITGVKKSTYQRKQKKSWNMKAAHAVPPKPSRSIANKTKVQRLEKRLDDEVWVMESFKKDDPRRARLLEQCERTRLALALISH
jgi:hypothetical protein